MFAFRHSGPHALHEMREIALLARLGQYNSPAPPRLAVWTARAAAFCALGAVMAVLAIPILTAVHLLLH